MHIAQVNSHLHVNVEMNDETRATTFAFAENSEKVKPHQFAVIVLIFDENNKPTHNKLNAARN